MQKKNWISAAGFLLCVCLLVGPSAAETEVRKPFEFSTAARIVSINLCADELLLRIANPGQILAVTRYQKSDEASRILKNHPGIKEIHGTAEDVLALKPDLVLASPYNRRETVFFLKQRGIFVLALKVPKNFEDIYKSIAIIARAVGREDVGREIIAKMKFEISKIPVGRISDQRALFLQSEGVVPGAGTFENAIISAVGVRNMAEELGIRDYGRLSLERIVVEKPEILIFTSDQKNKTSIRGEILSHPALRKAVPGLRTFVLPSCVLNCGSPSSMEAVKLLRSQLGK